MVSDVRQYPETIGKVYMWAKAYAAIYAKQGQAAAGTYAKDNIPEQFHKQIDPIVQEEYTRIKSTEEKQ